MVWPSYSFNPWSFALLSLAFGEVWSSDNLRKTVGKSALILVTLTLRSDSNFERSNVILKENKPDGVDPNSNDIEYNVRKNEGKILWFSADCIVISWPQVASQSMYTWHYSNMTWNSEFINVCFDLSVQRLMVKTTYKTQTSHGPPSIPRIKIINPWNP